MEDKVSAEEAEHARQEHADAEETMQRLERLDADDPAFDEELATLMAEIRVPITALARTAAGPAASLFDRMRDLATGRGSGD